MVEWIEPIYDRTPADVTRAKLQVKEWIEAIVRGETVTISDLKGYLNATDLNRVEIDTNYLSLSSHLTLTVKTDWDRDSLPTVVDVQRIIDNINALITEFEFEKFTYEMPTTILTYSHANTIEHNLSIIKYLLEDLSTRIQAEFTQIDLAANIEIKVALSFPFDVAFEQFDITTNIKMIDSKGISIEKIFDTMTFTLAYKVVDSKSNPVDMNLSLEFNIASEVNDSKSNPIIGELMTFCDLTSVINDSISNPILSDFDIYPMNLLFIPTASAPAIVKILNAIAIDFLTEATAYALITNKIEFELMTIADITNTTVSFADMFVNAIFTAIKTELSGKIIKTTSKSINSIIPSTIATKAIVCLFVYAKLSDYTSVNLKTMDSTTLKDLSYREL